MNKLDVHDEKLSKDLNNYLWQFPADFCLIYRKPKSWWRSDLNLRSATSLSYKSLQDCEESGNKYRLLASDCYRQSLDMVIEELVDPSSKGWISVRAWKARIFKALKIRTPTPANSNGQRWWQLVVASGPTRKAGYVIVTRVAARNIAELRQCIKGIQAIMKNEATRAVEMST